MGRIDPTSTDSNTQYTATSTLECEVTEGVDEGTAHVQGQGVLYDHNGQQVISTQPNGDPPVLVAVPARAAPGLLGPPMGHWKDGICNCFANCWPSCYCSFCCCDGIWLLSQISQKSGFASFPVVFFSYIVLQLACLVITVVTLYPIVFIPPACILLYGVVLRLHVVKRFNITSQNMCVECLQGFFCCCCSTAQMARHMVGYKKFLDGDSDISMPDQYNTV